jgi:hypothetical protein
MSIFFLTMPCWNGLKHLLFTMSHGMNSELNHEAFAAQQGLLKTG